MSTRRKHQSIQPLAAIPTEVERIAELENQGYSECGIMCADCGSEMLEKETIHTIADEDCLVTSRVCPGCCQHITHFEPL